MSRRLSRLNEQPVSEGGSYFTSDEKPLEFIHSGCQLLDCVLGGGWPIGRIANIVGDKSTGKTLLAIEAAANFAKQYPKGKIWYAEAEAAFDKNYAAALGMPLKRIDFVFEDEDNVSEMAPTVEKFFETLEGCAKKLKGKQTRGLFILDSLDALSDVAEQQRKIDEGTFGGNKPKKLGELFRRLVKHLEGCHICVIIISQTRQNIGVMFGEKLRRSGGDALGFYASQELWLSQLGKITRTSKGVKRTVGIDVRARCKKNKIGLPFRECDFSIRFGYGLDDVVAHLEWLKDVKYLGEFNDDLGTATEKQLTDYIKSLDQLDDAEYAKVQQELAVLVKRIWPKIEKEFLPKRKKYA